MYSEEEARKGMVKFVAAAELPLAIVDNEHFVNYVKQYLQPRYVGVSRNTLRSNTIEYFLNVKRLLIGDLEKYGGVISLTSDLWEGINKRGYIAATAHYIDPLWVMHKKIIAFKIVEYPHNANTIFNAIMLIIKEYKCESKIRSFTFDNASVNKVVIDKLHRVLQPDFGGYLFHIRCVCHIFNLIVQDGLKHVKDEISRIRNALTYITITPSRKQAFEEFCEQVGNSNTKTFITDVGHRWNSTYLLLKSCEGFEPFITEFYNNRHIRDDDDDILNESDWNTVFKIKKFLESFYTSTNILSGVYYPTSCMVLERLYITARAFNRYQNDPDFHAVIYAMELKFRKYWEELPMLFPLACVMDPRYNLSGTKFIIDQISNALTFNMPITYRNLEQTLTEMYELYASRIGTQVTRVPTPTPTNINDDDAEVINLLENIDSIRYDSTAYAYGSSSSSSMSSTACTQTSSSSPNALPSELIDYFRYTMPSNKSVKKSSEDVIEFWRNNERRWPIVSAIAKDLLTPPVSTVASESAFSAGKRVLSEIRSRLKEDILEALMCVKDWEDANYRIQHKYAEIACNQVSDI